MNYQFLDTEDLEIQEECIFKQKMVENMTENTILFGEKSLLGEFLLDAKYVPTLLAIVLT